MTLIYSSRAVLHGREENLLHNLGKVPSVKAEEGLAAWELLGEDLGLVAQRSNEEDVGVYPRIRLQDAGQPTRRDPVALHIGVANN